MKNVFKSVENLFIIGMMDLIVLSLGTYMITTKFDPYLFLVAVIAFIVGLFFVVDTANSVKRGDKSEEEKEQLRRDFENFLDNQ